MGAGFSLSRLPEIAPQLAAGAGISIGFEIFRRFVIASNRPASLKDGKDDQYDNIMVSFLHSSVSSFSLSLSFLEKSRGPQQSRCFRKLSRICHALHILLRLVRSL
ncbi:unnamed protein product [Oikopleura dioica]|uniref:Uncharacterized protein n=1 Tax=Oikopleura dioica TaxID=34765 RepID=E4WVK8_OIKDI|nr:unnamed protein product [Oikopleura dioica]